MPARYPKGSGVTMIIKKRKKQKAAAQNHLTYVYKYSCPKNHIRIEPELIKDKPLPFCTTCHMTTGEYVRIKYKSKAKRSKI